mgnify:CR=1 FL=1
MIFACKCSGALFHRPTFLADCSGENCLNLRTCVSGLISKNEIITKKFITKLWLDHGELFVLELKEILSIIDNKKVKMFLNTFNNAPPIFPISGKDLKKIGMSEGKKIGQIIKTTRDWWINNDCMPDKNKCISFIKKL